MGHGAPAPASHWLLATLSVPVLPAHVLSDRDRAAPTAGRSRLSRACVAHSNLQYGLYSRTVLVQKSIARYGRSYGKLLARILLR
jgi:hypothetical protein